MTTSTRARRVPAWPGNHPNLRGCIGAREMDRAVTEHAEDVHRHLEACGGCDDCRDWREGAIL